MQNVPIPGPDVTPRAPRPDDVRSVAVEITRRAIADWRSAKEFAEEMYDRIAALEAPPHGDPARHDVVARHNDWHGLAYSVEFEAESRLIRCILALGGRGLDQREPERHGQVPQALVLDGVVYMLVPEGAYEGLDEGEPAKDRNWAVRLVTTPATNLIHAGRGA